MSQSAIAVEQLRYYINGELAQSRTTQFYELHNPSTGEVTGKAPRCTREEVNSAIKAAKEAYPSWRDTPVIRRTQILFKVRELLIRHMDELTMLVAQENGKTWDEAQGDILKAKEGTELATQAASLMMGETLMNASTGFDTALYREPLGVFVGIVPVNFPAMIPFGWMAPVCLVCGNTLVLKAASLTPRTALRIAQLYKEAGLPDGVLNVITCSRDEVDFMLEHPDVKGVTFVGSTPVGRHIQEKAASAGKRVQALCQAKNHALIMADAPLKRTAAGVVNAAFGCAGQRCMALSCCVVEDSIADQFVEELLHQARLLKNGPAWEKETTLGPVTYAAHYEKVLSSIEKGVAEGARLILDGRGVKVPGYENGYHIGPTVFDHVTEDVSIGREEIFGPVLCIKRTGNFDSGLSLMNRNPYANGSVIFTQNGHYAREFARRTDGGMVGVNVGIPVPVGFFPFSGHKQSFFGDLHGLGKDAYRFYTESKCVTSRWFDEEEKKKTSVTTWDGTIG